MNTEITYKVKMRNGSEYDHTGVVELDEDNEKAYSQIELHAHDIGHWITNNATLLVRSPLAVYRCGDISGVVLICPSITSSEVIREIGFITSRNT